ncbi:MAG: dockerin type I repeat-containing protein [candidate division Zixibacteria bacterium]|nr:dockerin type I repeat-containing protein [candidate division Zixibacteria bacterium]
MRSIYFARKAVKLSICLLFGIFAIGSFCAQPAFAVTDYIYFTVNGDTAMPALIQGDSLSWASNCDVGSSVYWEIWFDANANSVIDEETDLILEATTVTDGDTSTDVNPIPDGWVQFPGGIVSLPVGPYIFTALNLSDSTSTQRIISNSEMSSPPNQITGQVFIPGHPAPDAILENIIISSEANDDLRGAFIGATDENGLYEINITDVGTGVTFYVEPTSVPGFAKPIDQIVVVSGVVGNINFTYQIPADSVYGYLRDDSGTLLDFFDWVTCEEQYPGDLEKGMRLKDSRYVIYFAENELGTWQINLDSDNAIPEYLVPNYFSFSHDTLFSFQHDLILTRTDTFIYARVTENGGLPANQYEIGVSSVNLDSWTRAISGIGSENVTAIQISSLDTDSWAVWINTEDDDYPIPDGMIFKNITSSNLSPGDTIDLELIDGNLVSDVITLDPGDTPINWEDVWIALYASVNKSYGTYVESGGVYNIYSDTGTFFIGVSSQGYLTNPAYRFAAIHGDTTGGLGFTINKAHCRVTGLLVNIPVSILSTGYSVSARTGTDGTDGYLVNALIDSLSGTYTINLCDGDWTLDVPYFDGYTSPTELTLTIGESPDTVQVFDLVYTAERPCGDANNDGSVNMGDAVYLINFIFRDGAPPSPLCIGKTNGDESVNVGDAVYLINFIFKDGEPPFENCCP